jgi:hypothetical protein
VLMYGYGNTEIAQVKIAACGWKSALDRRINNIVSWWFPEFHGFLTACKEHIIDTIHPPEDIACNWESDFAHLAVGINWTTHEHWDSWGVTHGVNCLLLTGNMTEGDLNVGTTQKPVYM